LNLIIPLKKSGSLSGLVFQLNTVHLENIERLLLSNLIAAANFSPH